MASTARRIVFYLALIALVLGVFVYVVLPRTGYRLAFPGYDAADVDARAALLVAYGANAMRAADEMRSLKGISPNDFNFIKPGTQPLSDDLRRKDVYDSAGGRLKIFETDASYFSKNFPSRRGWVAQQGTNVEWSQTSASDIIFTFVDVDERLCKAINKKLYNDEDIPLAKERASVLFVNGNQDDGDFTSAICPKCNMHDRFCVKDLTGAYAFYNVILGR